MTSLKPIDLPWVVIGDFNEVCSQTEKWGGNPASKSRMDLFNNTLNDCKLMDLGFLGPKFTWSNKRKHAPIHERLDRGCANDLWFAKFPNSSIHHLPKIMSDHCPLLLRLDHPPLRTEPKPFRFEPMWVLHDMFPSVVQKTWLAAFSLDSKLEQTRHDLIVWIKDHFGNVYHRKKRILSRLRGVENYLQHNSGSLFHLIRTPGNPLK